MQPRAYQEECLAHLKRESVIVNLATGMGKTLIATLAIDHYRATSPDKKAMFVVPTRVLVTQQAAYCRQYCNCNPRVVELSGQEMESWNQYKWRECMSGNDVLVGTAEVFRRALVDGGFISAGQFSLVVLDECHNAIGNSPMAAIMQDGVWPLVKKTQAPRILGLTASFVNGSMKNIQQKRQTLEALLQATLICPDTNQSMVMQRTFTQVSYPPDNIPLVAPFVEGKLNTILKRFEPTGIALLNGKQLVSRAKHVFEQLGMSAFLFLIRAAYIPQLRAHAEEMSERLTDPNAKRHAKDLTKALPKLQQSLLEAAETLASDGELTRAPLVSAKCEKLLELLNTLFPPTNGERNRRNKGIIFVTQVALTVPLAHLINTHVEGRFLAGAVSGVGSMTDSERKKTMEDFRRDKYDVLVCTNSLEEGVDVSACGFVIRFTEFDTTKSHIQGSGRARRADALVYYFDNDPEKEQESAQYMSRVARDESLCLSATQRLDRVKIPDVPGVYPFQAAGASSEINLFNGLQIVVEYCMKVMGQSVSPDDHLFKESAQVVREYPFQERKYISEVQYPSPDGMQTITLEQVNQHWGRHKPQDLLDPERLRNLDAKDLEKRRILYVVAIDMAKKGYIDSHNQPSTEAIFGTKPACPAFMLQSSMKVKNSFSKGSEVGMPGPSGSANDRSTSSGYCSTVAVPSNLGTNFKNLLQEKAQQIWRAPNISVSELLEYKLVSSSSNFTCSVTIVRLNKTFEGSECPRKKDAEQSAAQVALPFLENYRP